MSSRYSGSRAAQAYPGSSGEAVFPVWPSFPASSLALSTGPPAGSLHA